MEVFIHLSQLAGNNLHVMSGPRRQPTCWVVPWRSFPPPSSSIRPRAPCPEPAPSARLQTKMAQQMQVLQTTFTNVLSSFFRAPCLALFLFVTVILFPHAHAHHLREIACMGESKAYLSNECYSFTMAIDRWVHTLCWDKQFWIPLFIHRPWNHNCLTLIFHMWRFSDFHQDCNRFWRAWGYS